MTRFISSRNSFDFTQAHVDAYLIKHFHQLQFVDSALNMVFVGGPGTGKTHLADQPNIVRTTQRQLKKTQLQKTLASRAQAAQNIVNFFNIFRFFGKIPPSRPN